MNESRTECGINYIYAFRHSYAPNRSKSNGVLEVAVRLNERENIFEYDLSDWATVSVFDLVI